MLRLPLHPLCAAVLLSLATSTAVQAQGLVISQVYGGGGATTGSPSYKQDFVELFNASSAPVSLVGLSLQYGASTGVVGSSASNILSFTTGTVAPGAYFLVALSGGSVGADLPVSADANGTLTMSASAGKVALVQGSSSLACGSSTVTCNSTQLARVVDLVGFGGSGTTLFEGSQAVGALNNTSSAVRLAMGCTDTNQNSSDFTVITPAPAPRHSASPVNTSCVTGAPAPSPAPAPAPAPAVTPIGQIQGSGHVSPLLGQTVTTTGVVSKVLNNGFFMQSLVPDQNPDTSDGILVFTSTAPTVSAGQHVQLTGLVDEFNTGAATNTETSSRPVTELKTVSNLTVLSSGHTLSPLVVTFPEVQDNDLEKVEGMLVKIDTELTASQNYFLGRYGQITLSANGRLKKPTNLYPAGSVDAQNLTAENARRRILLDDGTSLQNPNPIPYIGADNTHRAGDTLPSLTGVVDFGLATASSAGLADYKIHPTEPVVFSRTNMRTSTPAAVGGNVKVASFIVLIYFNGDGLGGGFPTARGATNAVEFTRQRAKIIAALQAIDADAVGLMEIENDGESAQSAIADLVNGLNAAYGRPVYAAVPAPTTAGATGTDAIKVAMIYKPASLSLTGNAISDLSAIHNRPPLAQTFAAANGEKFSVVVNHFKSKGCDAGSAAVDLDQGDGQGCFNDRRTQQAEALHTFIQGIQTAQADADVLVIGDLNAYAKEDPILHLAGQGYVDLVASFLGQDGYSYVFDGEVGYLDHALATHALRTQVTGALEWHINADEPLVIDYNTEFKPQDLYTPTVYRSSDHDPVVIGLSLVKSINGSSRGDLLTGTAGDDRIKGGAGADQITTGTGRDVLVYDSIRDALDTVTDFTPGQDVIDLVALVSGLRATAGAAIDPLSGGFITWTDSASGLQIRVDADGHTGSATPRPLVTLRGVTASQFQAGRDLSL